MLKWCHEFYNNNNKKGDWDTSVFGANFFLSIIFSELNYYYSALFCLLFFFEVQKVWIAWLGLFCLASKKQCVKKYVFLSPFTFKSRYFPPPNKPPQPIFRPTPAAMPNCLTIQAKGQIISECIYEIIDFPKYHQKHLIDFCPEFRLGMLCTHLIRVALWIIKTNHIYLVFKTFQGRNLLIFFGGILENRWFNKYILILSDLYIAMS